MCVGTLQKTQFAKHYADHPCSLPVNRIRQPSAGNGQPLLYQRAWIIWPATGSAPNHVSAFIMCIQQTAWSNVVQWSSALHQNRSPKYIGDTGPPCVCIKRSFQRPNLLHSWRPPIVQHGFPISDPRSCQDSLISSAQSFSLSVYCIPPLVNH